MQILEEVPLDSLWLQHMLLFFPRVEQVCLPAYTALRDVIVTEAGRVPLPIRLTTWPSGWPWLQRANKKDIAGQHVGLRCVKISFDRW